MKRLILAVRRQVELGLEVLKRTVSDGLCSNLTLHNVTSLLVRDHIPLLALL